MITDLQVVAASLGPQGGRLRSRRDRAMQRALDAWDRQQHHAIRWHLEQITALRGWPRIRLFGRRR